MLEYEVPMFAATAPNKLLFPPVGKLRHRGRDSDASQMVNVMFSWKFYFCHLLVIVNSSVRDLLPRGREELSCLLTLHIFLGLLLTANLCPSLTTFAHPFPTLYSLLPFLVS